MDSTLGKIRFGVLWGLAGIAMAGAMAVFFYEPGVLEEGVAGVMEGDPVTMGMAQLMAAMAAVPLVMAAVALFLPTRAGAITNLAVGVPYAVAALYAAVPELAEGAWHAHLTLGVVSVAAVGLVVGLSIAELRRHSREDGAVASLTVELTARGA
ncbi:hypothetical protein OEB99_13600 [Actinotalea sp. M2MS4P-6]|uniref:hypothetical protein n=1 Tax=Actinotalea sp. M2MS4P-6 TaxID=2983762 RepID=UPI0021E4D93B|nr:hypothetical protein [Actinotalea sp. M2MS4P-6]MCV2395346.1 hypothetical protein [Actinotalea sp. M2MS4P-6]